MSLPITVPRLGWSMDEGTFVGWLKQDGEPVKAGEPLFTLEGDKAAQEVEALDSGILRIPADAPKPGAIVTVGTLLGYFETDEATATAPSEAPAAAAAPPSATTAPAAAAAGPGAPGVTDSERKEPSGMLVVISPRARRLAAELGVDYTRLRGSGRDGRIVEEDVRAAAKPAQPAGPSIMRRMIAQRTSESFARAPHFYLHTEVNATALLEWHQRRRTIIEEETGVRPTLTDLLLRAQGLALRDCPFANAIWQGDQVSPVSGRDVGVVVGLPDGLRIPILRGVDALALSELAKQRHALVNGARGGTLAAEAMQGGATSLSNLGNSCVDEFSAVISPPHSSILAVGRAASRPFVEQNQLVVRSTLKLCLSVDHRVMDGGPAAEFLGRIVAFLQEPQSLE